MSVVVMICYARSGGNLLNKCIGSLPNVVMLSEVNPISDSCDCCGQGKQIRCQAKEWYGVDLDSNSFSEKILELEGYCSYKPPLSNKWILEFVNDD